MPRRPDQAYTPPGAPLAPGSPSGIFRGRLVVVSAGSPGSGIFVYSPSPGLGHLVGEWSAVGGTDGSGNAYPAGFNIGVWNGSGTLTNHFGVNPSGDVFLASSTGAVIFHGRSSDGSFFFYDTTGEALGHISASIAPIATTDTPGNTVQGGVTAYQVGTNAYVQLFNGLINIIPNSGTKWQISPGATQLVIADLTDNRTIRFGLADSTVTLQAVQPGTANTAETWHTIAPVAGFTAGGTSPRYQFEAVNGGRVRLSGAVNLTANQIAGTTFFTLPANYIPARTFHVVTQNNLSGYAAGNASLTVDTSGNLAITVAGSTGNFLSLDGVDLELD